MIFRCVLAAAVAAATLTPFPAQARTSGQVRFATFNASLNRAAEGALVADLSTQDNAQAKVIAEIVQRARPDVLLINEFDYDPRAAALFRDNYLAVGQT